MGGKLLGLRVSQQMARSRNIKPGFFLNDVLGGLPPLARLMFAGLWTACDRDGRVVDRPARIKAEVLPYDVCDPDELLDMLHKCGFIDRYEVCGVRVIQVCAWHKHQNPHVKEQASTLPTKTEHQTSMVHASGSNGASAVKAEELPEVAVLIPSSLIPSSLIPDSLCKNKDTRKRAAASRLVSVEELVSEGVDQQAAEDWLVNRKTKGLPLTATAWKQTKDEASKAGLTPAEAVSAAAGNGWAGFRADWMGKASEAEPAWRRDQRERNEAFLGVAAKRKPKQEIVDATSKFLD